MIPARRRVHRIALCHREICLSLKKILHLAQRDRLGAAGDHPRLDVSGGSDSLGNNPVEHHPHLNHDFVAGIHPREGKCPPERVAQERHGDIADALVAIEVCVRTVAFVHKGAVDVIACIIAEVVFGGCLRAPFRLKLDGPSRRLTVHLNNVLKGNNLPQAELARRERRHRSPGRRTRQRVTGTSPTRTAKR